MKQHKGLDGSLPIRGKSGWYFGKTAEGHLEPLLLYGWDGSSWGETTRFNPFGCRLRKAASWIGELMNLIKDDHVAFERRKESLRVFKPSMGVR